MIIGCSHFSQSKPLYCQVNLDLNSHHSSYRSSILLSLSAWLCTCLTVQALYALCKKCTEISQHVRNVKTDKTLQCYSKLPKPSPQSVFNKYSDHCRDRACGHQPIREASDLRSGRHRCLPRGLAGRCRPACLCCGRASVLPNGQVRVRLRPATKEFLVVTWFQITVSYPV